MKRLVIVYIPLFLSIWTSVCGAYEPDTHARLSNDAASNSVLNNTVATPTIPTTVLQDLGIGGYNADTFPNTQYGQTVQSGPGLFFAPSFAASNRNGTVQYLITTGAQLEDAKDRAFCHFYDPISGDKAPLDFTFAGTEYTASHAAVEWATGSSDPTLTTPITDTCNIPSVPNPYSLIFTWEQQDYSLVKANQYFYDALTKQNRSDRDSNFGNLFLSIGHVLHLLEDMGQPQHVRDDMHCDSPACLLIGRFASSEYEKYAYGNYDGISPDYTKTPDFPNSQDFWATGDQRGLAEYTNMNFVSVGTTVSLTGSGGSYEYFMPAPDVTRNVDIQDVFNYIGTTEPEQIQSYCQAPRACKMEFITNTVYDDNANPTTTATNQWAASKSIFNDDLTGEGDHEFYRLNAATYKSAEDFLFQKVKAYSAGLINHFFRGRLGVDYDLQTPGNYVVTNLSKYAMSNGTLEAYYDDASGVRHKIDSATQNQLSLDAHCTSGCNDSVSVSVSLPSGATPATPGQYVFVFDGRKGAIGSEAGVAAMLFDPSYDIYVGQNINANYTPAQEPNFMTERKSDGTLVKNFSIVKGELNAPFFIGVYNKTIYVSPGFDGGGYGTTNGNIRAYSYPGYSTTSNQLITTESNGLSFLDGFAINNKYIFAPVVKHPAAGTDGAIGYAIRVLDHSGNLVQDISVSGEVGNLSANDKHICALVGGESELLDMQGQVVANLVPFPYNNYFDNMICGSTSDRHYVLSQYNDANEVTYDTVYVFDDNGTPITSFTIDGTLHDGAGFQIAATATHIYISFLQSSQYESGVAVFNRIVTYNSDGSIAAETYQRAADIGDGEWTSYGGVAVDSATVLNNP